MATFITFIIVLSILVFVHELGHFAAAKFFKVRVDEFSIGFPPRIFSKKKGDTLYSINWIPLGGYVKIKGEAGEDKEDPDSFAGKPIYQRAIILAAGVIMNFIAAAIFISWGSWLGLPTPLEGEQLFMERFARIETEQIQIVNVLEDSPAAEAGVELGYTIGSIDGQTFADIEGIQNYIRDNHEQTLAFTFNNGDESVTKDVQPVLLDEPDVYGIGIGLAQNGIVSYPFYIAPIHGTYRAATVSYDIVVAFGGLIRDLVVDKGTDVPLAGPVGIAVLTGKASQLGFVYLLQFTALLSLNLAIINLLPIPALDGSKLLLLVVEKIRGRAVNEQIENWAHLIGFAALMLLMLVVTYQDVIRYGGSALEKIGF